MDKLTKALVALLILIFLFFFWPGYYQYHTTGSGVLVRVHRISGETHHYSLHQGWISRSPETAPTPLVDGYGRPRPTPSVDIFGNPIPPPTPK